MASYGYGYGASAQSQAYSNVQSSYTGQASAGYASQASYGTTQSTGGQRQVMQGYDVSSGYGTTSGAYGAYGRQQDSTGTVQASHSGYGSYGVSRDNTGYAASKTNYGYGTGSQVQASYGYGTPKQSYSTGTSAAVYGTQQVQPKQSTQSYGMSQSAGQAGSSYGSYASRTQQQSHSTSSYGTAQSSSTSSGYSSSGVSASTTATQQSHQKNRQQSQPTQQHQNTYDTVVYNAATSFLQNQSGQTSKAPWQKQQKPQFKFQNQKTTKPPPKQQQLHYCDVCKISCAGPQTYKEHLEGQKHKKKAASVQTANKEPVPEGSFRCDLCDVTCTGIDAYNAHVKGARHQKTVKLHQKLGKPIPEIKAAELLKKEERAALGKVTSIKTVTKSVAPKINFVGGSKLVSTGSESKEVAQPSGETAMDDDDDDDKDDIGNDNEIIGEEYIENIKSDVGKVIGYKCTLCDCRFNDVVARTAHVKGRRHKLSYKKKVQPSLKVDVKGRKPSRAQEEMRKRAREHEMVWRQRQQEQMRWEHELRLREEELRRWEEEEYMRRIEEDRYWTRPDRHRMYELEHYEWERRAKYFEPHGPGIGGLPPPTPDDKLVMAKHSSIYPNENELKQVQNIVAAAEKALKLVSDQISEEDDKAKHPEKAEVEKIEVKKDVDDKKEGNKEDKKDGDKKGDDAKIEKKTKTDKQQPPRVLKGVMRVGVLAKGLLLHDGLGVNLVVLCAEKPTYSLLIRVGKLVPEKLAQVTEEKYETRIIIKGCSLQICSLTEPKVTVTVNLTSPAMREGPEEEGEGKASTVDERDVLEKDICLEALASLRHAKWFQARANGVHSCVIVIRILRDLCRRVPAFQPLSGWAVELLAEKSLSSCHPVPLGPGEAFRRCLEVIASGIFLPGGPGIHDPCEKEATDAVAKLTAQEREDLTAAAQHALRLHAFRQLHKVLGIEPLKPPPRRGRGRGKRRRDESVGSKNGAKMQKKEEEKAEGKKEEVK